MVAVVAVFPRAGRTGRREVWAWASKLRPRSARRGARSVGPRSTDIARRVASEPEPAIGRRSPRTSGALMIAGSLRRRAVVVARTAKGAWRALTGPRIASGTAVALPRAGRTRCWPVVIGPPAFPCAGAGRAGRAAGAARASKRARSCGPGSAGTTRAAGAAKTAAGAARAARTAGTTRPSEPAATRSAGSAVAPSSAAGPARSAE
jgi:hypothetical protein